MTEFTAFYTPRPFWAVDSIDMMAPALPTNLKFLLSEVVFSHDDDGYTLAVCRDGLILLRIYSLEDEKDIDYFDTEVRIEWWSKYLDYLNCLHLLLDASEIEVLKRSFTEFAEISRRDAFRVTVKDGSIQSEGFASDSISLVYQLDRILCDQDDSQVLKTRLNARILLPQDVFDTLVGKIAPVFANPALRRGLSEVARSLSNYKIGQYDTSLILSWFVIESIIAKLWQSYIEDLDVELPNGTKRLSSNRRKNLKSTRDYPVSVITNFLELASVIDTEVFNSIDKVRRWRNKVVHQDPGFSCSHDHCREAMELALAMSLEEAGLSIEIPMEFAFRVIGP